MLGVREIGDTYLHSGEELFSIGDVDIMCLTCM